MQSCAKVEKGFVGGGRKRDKALSILWGVRLMFYWKMMEN